MSQKYFPVEDQLQFRAMGLIKISVAWFMGAIALWFYANQSNLLDTYTLAFGMYLVLVKLVGFFGWRDYARSKGYDWKFGFLSFLPFVGPGLLVFLDDKWQEQELPKVKIRKLSW